MWVYINILDQVIWLLTIRNGRVLVYSAWQGLMEGILYLLLICYAPKRSKTLDQADFFQPRAIDSFLFMEKKHKLWYTPEMLCGLNNKRKQNYLQTALILSSKASMENQWYIKPCARCACGTGGNSCPHPPIPPLSLSSTLLVWCCTLG